MVSVGNGEEASKLQGQQSYTLTTRYFASQARGAYIVERRFMEITKNKSQGSRIYDIEGIATNLTSYGGGLGARTGLYQVQSTHLSNLGMKGRRQKNNNEASFKPNTLGEVGITINSRIRRLTPLECERLMGWADNHTKYGIDEKGNKVEISDNQRYKMCGNGVVSTVIRELVKLIA